MIKFFRYLAFFSLIYGTLSFIVGFNYTRENGLGLFGVSFMLMWPITVFLLTTAHLAIKDRQQEDDKL
jgi:hypothetical protein